MIETINEKITIVQKEIKDISLLLQASQISVPPLANSEILQEQLISKNVELAVLYKMYGQYSFH